MGNPYRGEAVLQLGETSITLRLTLGALAELEAAFGVEGLAALGQRLSGGTLAAKDLIRLLGPLARAGGTRLGDAELAARVNAADLPHVVEALAACFAAAMPETAARP
jgi:Phage tail tube protein, GTA-gp10